jgi:hypothetical protein
MKCEILNKSILCGDRAVADKQFAKGIYFNLPHERAPDFVIGRISIQATHFRAWLADQHEDAKGYVNLQVKKAKDGKPYVELDTWKPKGEKIGRKEPDFNDDDSIPF